MLKANDLRLQVLHYFADAETGGECVVDVARSLRLSIGPVCNTVQLFDRKGFVTKLDNTAGDPSSSARLTPPRFTITDKGREQLAVWDAQRDPLDTIRSS